MGSHEGWGRGLPRRLKAAPPPPRQLCDLGAHPLTRNTSDFRNAGCIPLNIKCILCTVPLKTPRRLPVSIGQNPDPPPRRREPPRDLPGPPHLRFIFLVVTGFAPGTRSVVSCLTLLGTGECAPGQAGSAPRRQRDRDRPLTALSQGSLTTEGTTWAFQWVFLGRLEPETQTGLHARPVMQTA